MSSHSFNCTHPGEQNWALIQWNNNNNRPKWLHLFRLLCYGSPGWPGHLSPQGCIPCATVGKKWILELLIWLIRGHSPKGTFIALKYCCSEGYTHSLFPPGWWAGTKSSYGTPNHQFRHIFIYNITVTIGYTRTLGIVEVVRCVDSGTFCPGYSSWPNAMSLAGVLWAGPAPAVSANLSLEVTPNASIMPLRASLSTGHPPDSALCWTGQPPVALFASCCTGHPPCRFSELISRYSTDTSDIRCVFRSCGLLWLWLLRTMVASFSGSREWCAVDGRVDEERERERAEKSRTPITNPTKELRRALQFAVHV